MLVVAASTFALTAWMFITIPKGFFPEEDIGQIHDHHRGRRGHLLPRHAGAAGPRGGCAAGRSQRGLRQLLHRRRRPDRHAERRPAVRRAQAAQRAPRHAAGARIAAQALPRDPRRRRLHAAGAEPAPGRAAEQGALPVHAAERERRRDERLGRPADGAHARRPGLPRRHQRFAEPRPAGHARHRPRQGRRARRRRRRPAHRALQRLRRPADRQHLRAPATPTR